MTRIICARLSCSALASSSGGDESRVTDTMAVQLNTSYVFHQWCIHPGCTEEHTAEHISLGNHDFHKQMPAPNKNKSWIFASCTPLSVWRMCTRVSPFTAKCIQNSSYLSRNKPASQSGKGRLKTRSTSDQLDCMIWTNQVATTWHPELLQTKVFEALRKDNIGFCWQSLLLNVTAVQQTDVSWKVEAKFILQSRDTRRQQTWTNKNAWIFSYRRVLSVSHHLSGSTIRIESARGFMTMKSHWFFSASKRNSPSLACGHQISVNGDYFFFTRVLRAKDTVLKSQRPLNPWTLEFQTSPFVTRHVTFWASWEMSEIGKSVVSMLRTGKSSHRQISGQFFLLDKDRNCS